MEDIDTDVSNYTLSELIAIVDVKDMKPDTIIEYTNYLIRKYKTKNPAMSVFFTPFYISNADFQQAT